MAAANYPPKDDNNPNKLPPLWGEGFMDRDENSVDMKYASRLMRNFLDAGVEQVGGPTQKISRKSCCESQLSYC